VYEITDKILDSSNAGKTRKELKLQGGKAAEFATQVDDAFDFFAGSNDKHMRIHVYDVTCRNGCVRLRRY
jgi:hypothetical protein